MVIYLIISSTDRSTELWKRKRRRRKEKEGRKEKQTCLKLLLVGIPTCHLPSVFFEQFHFVFVYFHGKHFVFESCLCDKFYIIELSVRLHSFRFSAFLPLPCTHGMAWHWTFIWEEQHPHFWCAFGPNPILIMFFLPYYYLLPSLLGWAQLVIGSLFPFYFFQTTSPPSPSHHPPSNDNIYQTFLFIFLLILHTKLSGL